MKTIILIPPNGELKKQDFLFERLCFYFIETLKAKVILLCINNKEISTKCFHKKLTIIQTENQKEIFSYLKKHSYDYILSRGWMHAYSFSAELVKKFENVLVYIKDWNFSTQEEYKLLFKDDSDFKAIEYIFQNAKLVLSHYGKKQHNLWAKEYCVSKEKFVFFPEYCNADNFNNKPITLNKKEINLVFAGTIPPSSYPEEFFLTKGLIEATKLLTSQKINVNVVLPPIFYKRVKGNDNFKDLVYYDKFLENFNIIEGKDLDSSVLNAYDFGIFNLKYTVKSKELNKYAVPSKFAFYLEAGIPLLINDQLKELSKIVTKHGIGLVYNNNNLENLHNILNKLSKKEYLELVNNVKKFRDKFTYKSSIKLIKEKIKWQ